MNSTLKDLYVGTYTRPNGSKGIYHFQMDLETGNILGGKLATIIENPSFLVSHPSGKYIYSTSEINNFQGKTTGSVHAYSIAKDGTLKELNHLDSLGAWPCHLCLDDQGHYLFSANYAGGNFSIFPINQKDGSLEEHSEVVQHKGSGPHQERQEGPHVHAVYLRDSLLYVCDLGTDHVDVYSFDAKTGKVTPIYPSHTTVPAGSGPRHAAFHNNHIYVINELTSSITVFPHNKGVFSDAIQNVSLLPPNHQGFHSAAEIEIHPNGKYLFASNRGHDSIATFEIKNDGTLKLLHHTLTQGQIPRHFTLDPSGKWLLVANQESNTIVVFKVDVNSGELIATSNIVSIAAPTCITFV